MRNNKNPTLGCLSYCNSRIIPANKKSQAAMEQPFQNAGKRIESRHKAYCNNRIIPANKKSQAAMEFLMTYGWALLVVIVVIAALAYFGLLNPSRFLPEKCEFQPGITCPGFRAVYDEVLWSVEHFAGHDGIIQTGGIQLFIQNGIGERMYDVTLEIDECNAVTPISGDLVYGVAYHPITIWSSEVLDLANNMESWSDTEICNTQGLDCGVGPVYFTQTYDSTFPLLTRASYEHGSIPPPNYFRNVIHLNYIGPIGTLTNGYITYSQAHPPGETISYYVSNCGGIAPNSRLTSDITLRYKVRVAGQEVERTNRGRISVWVNDLRE